MPLLYRKETNMTLANEKPTRAYLTNTTDVMKSIVVDIYCRVSTDPQEDNTSFDEQERSAREYCREHHLIVGMVHKETFTGFKYRERKKLGLMRERYTSGKIQGVVVRTLDRLSRRQVHAGVLMEEMEHHGVAFHCVMEPVHSEDKAMDQFIRMVLAFVAEMEREKIMDRTMTGRVNAVKQGSMKAVSTHKLRYGFQWADAEKTKIILSETEVAPGETEADIVRWMAEQYASGSSMVAIRQILDGRGIPSPSGKTWRECTILRILGDRRITGENAQVFVNKAKRYKNHFDTVTVPDGTYPAIISTEIFEKIQRRMETNKAAASRSSRTPEEFLLRAGYVRCSICGWSMGARNDYRYGTFIYRCRAHGSIVSKPLDAAIWAKIEQLADHVMLIEEAISLATADDKLQRDVAAIDMSISKWKQTAANYLDDLRDSSLTGESRAAVRKQMNDANIMIQKLEDERAQLAIGIVDRERQEAAYKEILEWCREVKEARGELPYQRKRDFLEMLGVVVTIVYDKEKGNQGRPTWNMKVRSPALQAIINPPVEPETCDAHIVE